MAYRRQRAGGAIGDVHAARSPAPEEALMVLVVVGATVLLCMAIGLFGGTILAYLRAARMQPSRVEEIRHLRQAGLAIPRAEEGTR
jgi:hypothetical protein